MATLWRFSAKKNSGFLALYVLYSLKNKPKSGYAILSELKVNGGEGLSPSKGSLYPLLKSLAKDGFIRLTKTGARSKHIFEITPKGKKFLSDFRKEKESMNERFLQFQRLFANLLGEQKTGVIRLLIEIRKLALKKNHEKVIKELKSCLNNIQKI
jgi:DNA-binding PadR family transcriptional regulator